MHQGKTVCEDTAFVVEPQAISHAVRPGWDQQILGKLALKKAERILTDDLQNRRWSPNMPPWPLVWVKKLVIHCID
jgi:hypothetical protein